MRTRKLEVMAKLAKKNEVVNSMAGECKGKHGKYGSRTWMRKARLSWSTN